MATKSSATKVKPEVQPEMTANDYAELQVHRAFMSSYTVQRLYEATSEKFPIGELTFTKVFSNTDEGHDDEEPQERYCVWQVGDLYVRLDGTVNSYGTKEFESWKFVKPKEKTVVVYE